MRKNYDPVRWIREQYNNINSIVKIAFWFAIIIGTITHIALFTGQFVNEDYVNLTSDLKPLYTSGRWFLGYVAGFRGIYNIPIAIAGITLFYLGLSAGITVKLLNIKHKITAILIAALMVTFPTLSHSFGYLFMADSYATALFLAVLSVYLADRYKYGYIFGIIPLMLSMSIYQSYIGYSIIIILIYIILKLIDNKEQTKAISLKVFKFIIMGIGSVVSYFIVLKIVLTLVGGELSQYKGMSEMGKITLTQVPTLISNVYKNFFKFFTGKYFYVSEILLMIYIGIFLSLIYFIIALLKRNRVYLDWQRNVILVISLISLPIGAYVVDIMAPQAGTGPLTIYQMVGFFILYICLWEKYFYGEDLVRVNKLSVFCNWITMLLIIGVIYNYFLISQTYYLKIETFYERTYSLANRILGRIEEMPQFKDNKKIAILGSLPNIHYSSSSQMFDPIVNDEGLYGQYVGLSSDNPFATYKFVTYVDNFLGVQLQVATPEEIEEVKNSHEIDDMGVWPENSSIKEIKDIIVVNLNYSLSVEIEKLDGNKYRFINRNNLNMPDNCQYAWYVYKNEEQIFTQWYTPEPSLEYIFNEPGEYKVLMFVTNQEGEMIGTEYSDIIEIK